MYANIYVIIKRHGLSAGVRTHYVTANGVRNGLGPSREGGGLKGVGGKGGWACTAKGKRAYDGKFVTKWSRGEM